MVYDRRKVAAAVARVTTINCFPHLLHTFFRGGEKKSRNPTTNLLFSPLHLSQDRSARCGCCVNRMFDLEEERKENQIPFFFFFYPHLLSCILCTHRTHTHTHFFRAATKGEDVFECSHSSLYAKKVNSNLEPSSPPPTLFLPSSPVHFQLELCCPYRIPRVKIENMSARPALERRALSTMDTHFRTLFPLCVLYISTLKAGPAN